MLEMYGDILTQVQKILVNRIKSRCQCAMRLQVPTIVYALVAGSLSDRFGRGPLLVLPIIGQILEGAALLVNKVQL